MKSYTDIEQSKTLSKILPLESADMGWNVFVDGTTRILPINDWDLVKDGSGNVKFYHAWSLVALLGVIREAIGYNLYGVNNVRMSCDLGDKPWELETEVYDNEIDACVDMIIKLHEMNLL